MADIKDLSIFGGNKGLQAIKAAEEKKSKLKEQQVAEELRKSEEIRKEKERKKEQVNKKVKVRKNAKGAGAPIRNFDRVYSATQPIKLSALLNGTLKVLTEKYMTSDSKDEILRKALNDYVKHNLTKEDKLDLLNDLSKDLKIFREKFPTVEEVDVEGNVIQNVQEIERKTIQNLRNSWGI